MKKLFFYFLIFSSPFVKATEGLFFAGGRAASMSNASITSQDLWALYNNPAGLAFIKTAEAGISYEKRFALKELSTNGLALAFHTGKTDVIGVNATYFGFKNYYEQQAGICYAKQFGRKVSAAVKINYQSFNFGSEYGSRNLITYELGMQAMIARNLWLGSHLYNPLQPKITDEPKEYLPSVFSFGAGYLFSEKFNMQLAAEKNSSYDSRFRAGFEYHPVNQFWLRSGIASRPFVSSFGFGLALENFQFDFAVGFHPQLGATPNLSLAYRFNRNK